MFDQVLEFRKALDDAAAAAAKARERRAPRKAPPLHVSVAESEASLPHGQLAGSLFSDGDKDGDGDDEIDDSVTTAQSSMVDLVDGTVSLEPFAENSTFRWRAHSVPP